MTTLDDVREGWQAAAQQDAMGHILTTGTPWSPEAFFQHGQTEIQECLNYLDEKGLRGERRQRALDFGCGVGRLTQALADHYKRVDGVDIAQSMVTQARAHNRHGERVQYMVRDTLTGLRTGAYDLVYSILVLQHMPQEVGHEYIHQFIRLLHKDGLAVFNVPDGPDVPHPTTCLSMWSTPPSVVEEVVKGAGGVLVDTQLLGHDGSWAAYRYTARVT